MKRRMIASLLLTALLPVFVFAEQVTFYDNTGAGVTVDLPSEVAAIVKDNQFAIQSQILADGASAA